MHCGRFNEQDTGAAKSLPPAAVISPANLSGRGVAGKESQTAVKNALALVLAAVSAYAFSFAIDLLLDGLFGIYANTAVLAVGTWGAIAIITIIAAVCLAPDGRFLVIPFVVIALLALFGGIVARHYGLMVGILMLVQSAAIWLMTARRAR